MAPSVSFMHLLPAILREQVSTFTLASQQVLHLPGDPVQRLYLLETGQIRLVNAVDEQVITCGIVRPGELVSEVTLYVPTYPVMAVADRASRVVAIPKEGLIAAMQQLPELTQAIQARVASRLVEAKTLLELRSIHRVRTRILRYLNLHVGSDGRTVMLDRPFRDVAGELNMAPEVLSRYLKRLENEGLLCRQRRRIWLSEAV